MFNQLEQICQHNEYQEKVQQTESYFNNTRKAQK